MSTSTDGTNFMDQQPNVVVVLKGGIGNQLFQYAAGLGAARHMGAHLFVHQLDANSVRLGEMLEIDLAAASSDMLNHVGAITRRPAIRRTAQRMRRKVLLARGNVVHLSQPWEAAHSPMPRDLLRPGLESLYLDGYFQHPSWYNSSLAALAGILGQRLTHIVSPDVGTNATVVAFRRGDYVRMNWDLPLSFYEGALANASLPDGPIWVVGDDQLVTGLCAPWFERRGMRLSPAPALGGGRFLRDLALLAAADHVVMANSTYCWWGVNAGDPDVSRSDRTIVAPAPWTPLKGSNALIRPTWLTAETEPDWAAAANSK
jgi:hypothetical protein